MAESEKKEGKKTITIKLPKLNLWMASTIVLIIALAVVLLGGFQPSSILTAGGNSTANKAIDYINNNLVTTGAVTFVSVEDFNGLYKVTTSYQGQKISIYATKDGKYLFVSQPFDTSVEIPTTTTTAEEIPQKEKASAELFVMSFCPYGVQAEDLMKPVFDLLGSKADIKIRFIARVSGDTINDVSSLHGENEAAEDLRQLCIMKNYDAATYWKYLEEFNKNCYPQYSDDAKLDACWKATADKFGIDKAKIESCASGKEGIDLLKADEQIGDGYGVTGSPTLIVNGETYSGSRTSDAYKQAICSGFTTPPAECSQTLSSEGTTASGGC